MSRRNYGTRLARNFNGRVAIVRGGTSGIGRALCLALGRLGATVVVAGRNMERADEVVAQIRSHGGKARADRVDVTVRDAVDALVNRTLDRYGCVDFMFNNAGVAILGEAQDISVEAWRSVIDANLWGVRVRDHGSVRRDAEAG